MISLDHQPNLNRPFTPSHFSHLPSVNPNSPPPQPHTVIPAISRTDQEALRYFRPGATLNTSTPDLAAQRYNTQQPAHHPQSSSAYPTNTNTWLSGTGSGQMIATSALHASTFDNRYGGHQRAASSSSVGSNSPATPFSPVTSAMYTGRSSAIPKVDSSYNVAEEASRNYSNHLPTPTQTPTQDTFLAASGSTYPQFSNLDSSMATHMSSMKQALADGNSLLEDDTPGFSHSTRHSVSSLGRNSPSTPRTVNGEDFDENFKAPSNDLAVRPVQVPKFERTLNDAYVDDLWYPTSTPTSASQKPARSFPSLLSPYHNAMVTERLQQANQARSQSPTINGSRGVSPFRQGSPYAQSATSFASPQSRLNAGAQFRQKQKADAEALALSHQNPSSQHDNEPKTISPKDAVLEYHESDDDSKMPLFSDADNAAFNPYANGSFPASLPMSTKTSDNSYGSLKTGGVNGWTNPSGTNSATAYSAASSTATPSHPQFNFAPSSVPGLFHGLSTNTFAPTSVGPALDETPEFPAHLTSMESSASEAPPHSSQNSNNADVMRPTSTLADTGTYTCTYHGCTQRFETPQKLQRHKREAHRQSNTQPSQTPNTPGVGSGMTSAALAARNSQAGPHKCDRINPTTGKPCNTIFSRPYDLTRHEDTIHNIRKQKVRCALCQEEKTFSRNDALTRHMRVVHPDVDFPGKHRKRGVRSDD